jgi:hypothetical protein
MNTQKLALGNLVSSSRGDIVEVIIIAPYGIVGRRSSGGVIGISSDSIVPIALSEYWFLKLGFKQVDTTPVFKLDVIVDGIDSTLTTELYTFDGSPTPEDISNLDSKVFNNVHELQNYIYFTYDKKLI